MLPLVVKMSNVMTYVTFVTFDILTYRETRKMLNRASVMTFSSPCFPLLSGYYSAGRAAVSCIYFTADWASGRGESGPTLSIPSSEVTVHVHWYALTPSPCLPLPYSLLSGEVSALLLDGVIGMGAGDWDDELASP